DMKIRAMGLCAICVALSLIGAGAGRARQSNAAPSGSNQTESASPSGLTVHEWGTFTSVAGKDGAAIEWRPLDGSSDLPNFVYITENLPNAIGVRSGERCVKCNYTALVRMETPVIYFYSDHELTVSVRVEFPNGKITEWYPQSRSVYDTVIDWGTM